MKTEQTFSVAPTACQAPAQCWDKGTKESPGSSLQGANTRRCVPIQQEGTCQMPHEHGSGDGLAHISNRALPRARRAGQISQEPREFWVCLSFQIRAQCRASGAGVLGPNCGQVLTPLHSRTCLAVCGLVRMRNKQGHGHCRAQAGIYQKHSQQTAAKTLAPCCLEVANGS